MPLSQVSQTANVSDQMGRDEIHENSVQNGGVIGTLMKISGHTKSQG